MRDAGCRIRVSSPGSLMLLGEHAVLHGRRALVCAINKRITVSHSQINNPILRIGSDLGTYEAPLDNLKDHSDFRFVLDAVKQYSPNQGIELKIESEFASDIGFGSSAAVTVATHAALMGVNFGSLGEFALPGRATPPAEPFLFEIFKRSLATIHRVQGRGSGADVAASVFGGVVAYRAEPLEIHPLAQSFPLTAVYSGSKMKTADVIRYLEERRALNADYFERIFDRMDASVGEVIKAAEVERDRRARFACPPKKETRPAVAFHQKSNALLECLGRNLILNQKLMEEMGLCNAALAEIIRLFGEQNIPAKISGSGLGDCAVGLGSVAPTGLPASSGKPFGDYPVYALQVEPRGVEFKSEIAG